jgi:hypothetical protein
MAPIVSAMQYFPVATIKVPQQNCCYKARVLHVTPCRGAMDSTRAEIRTVILLGNLPLCPTALT